MSDSFVTPSNIFNSLLSLPYAMQIARLTGVNTSTINLLRAGRSKRGVLSAALNIMTGMPDGLIAEFSENYRDTSFVVPDSKRKYYDLPVHLLRSMWQAHELGLDKEQGKIKILDMGMGFGYFVLACEHLGHDISGVDLGEGTVYENVTRKLDTLRKRIPWCITADAPLPENIGTFDLITAFQPMFDYGVDGRLWNVDQWKMFFQTIRPCLNDNAKLYLGLNTVKKEQLGQLEEKKQYFDMLGGTKCMDGWLFDVTQLS